jgi:hypothetical protein
MSIPYSKAPILAQAERMQMEKAANGGSKLSKSFGNSYDINVESLVKECQVCTIIRKSIDKAYGGTRPLHIVAD